MSQVQTHFCKNIREPKYTKQHETSDFICFSLLTYLLLYTPPLFHYLLSKPQLNHNSTQPNITVGLDTKMTLHTTPHHICSWVQYWVQYLDSILSSILGSISVLDVPMNLYILGFNIGLNIGIQYWAQYWVQY